MRSSQICHGRNVIALWLDECAEMMNIIPIIYATHLEMINTTRGTDGSTQQAHQ